MKPSINDKLIAYLVLLSGLAISAVAEYYSIMGLIAIYPAALIPIVIMGVVLGLGKISGTVWLKQNWEWSPFFLKAYVLPAIVVLMLITSLGVFGFLSKAHSDQSLVSGDVQSKIAVYDEKIKVAKDNIDANRKALKQMDEAVDQVMGRSSDEKGADKAVAIRRAQQKERVRLQSEIAAEQKAIAALSEERAPIAAEVRKVDAEVGPIKYIAHLLYGENPDANILEKAVIWVTVLIVIVLDPLAVVLLLASQYSFQRFRELEEKKDWIDEQEDALNEAFNDPELAGFFERSKEVARRLDAGESLEGIPGYIAEPIEEEFSEETTSTEATPVPVELDAWNKMIAEAEKAVEESKKKIDYQILEDVSEEDDPPLLDKHPYLNKPFAHFTNTTPMVYKPEDSIQKVPTEETPNFEGVRDVNTGEWIQTGPDLEPNITVDYDTLPADTEYVQVNGQNMHIRAAKSLYKQTPKNSDKEQFTEVVEPEIKFSSYIQNEEQGENTKWARVISEAEYRDSAKINNDNKNNPNNAT